MPENTTVPAPAPAPVAPTTTAAATAAKKEEDVIVTSLTIGELPVNHKIYGRKVKGKEEEQEVCIPDPAMDSLAYVLAVAKFVGIPNFVGTLQREVFRPFAYEASNDGFTAEGKFNGVKYLEAFKAQFDPRQSKARGPKKAEILQQQAKYTEELTELIVKATSGNFAEADKNRFMVIKLELAKLSELAAKKDRRGKAPVATPATPAKK